MRKSNKKKKAKVIKEKPSQRWNLDFDSFKDQK